MAEEATEDELASAKAAIMGSFARSLESPQTIAGFAINTARYNLPDDYYSGYLKRLDAVTIADVKAMAEKYIRPENANIIIVGKAREIASKVEKFGKVQYVDVYGNPYEPAAESLLPEGLTADKVIENYLTAIGGKENITKIKNIKTVYTGSMMGRDMEVTQQKTNDLKMKQVVEMAGMVVMEAVCDGENVKTMQMGQTVPMDEKTTEEQIVADALFSDLLLKDKGAELKLAGVEKIDGKDAYAIEITLSKGGNYTVHYEVESGLKVRYTKSMDTPQGNFIQIINFSDYKEVEGVKFSIHIKSENRTTKHSPEGQLSGSKYNH